MTQKIAILTRACRLTAAGLLFVFVDHRAGIRRATYLCLDYAKNVDKNWNITVSLIIHVNFDHAWAEHLKAPPVVCKLRSYMQIYKLSQQHCMLLLAVLQSVTTRMHALLKLLIAAEPSS